MFVGFNTAVGQDGKTSTVVEKGKAARVCLDSIDSPERLLLSIVSSYVS